MYLYFSAFVNTFLLSLCVCAIIDSWMAFTLLYVTRDKYACSAFLGWWSIKSLYLHLSLSNDVSLSISLSSSLQVLVLMTVPVEAPAWPSRTCPDLRGPLKTALYCDQGTASVSPTLTVMPTLSLPVTATEGSLGRIAHYVSVLFCTAVLLFSHQRNFRRHWLLIRNLCFSSISFPHLSFIPCPYQLCVQKVTTPLLSTGIIERSFYACILTIPWADLLV